MDGPAGPHRPRPGWARNAIHRLAPVLEAWPAYDGPRGR